jgi:hypothetical protein
LRVLSKNNIHRVALACFVAAGALRAQQPVPVNRARLAAAVIADLSKLSDLERAFFAANGHYTDDVKLLHFTPASGAAISVSYASARTFSASASHFRLSPFLCFVIVSAVDAASPADKPFCTDSRYGTAAAALASAGTDSIPRIADAKPDSLPPEASAIVTPRTKPGPSKKSTPSVDSSGARAVMSPSQFAARLREAARARTDSTIVTVQFAVKDARYDPSRGVVEVAVERIPLPSAPGTDSTRLALACFTQPAFVCGAAGLSYIARDLLRVPRATVLDPALLKSGLTLDARFAVGRRGNTPGTSLTLLALVLQAKGTAVARWAAAITP